MAYIVLVVSWGCLVRDSGSILHLALGFHGFWGQYFQMTQSTSIKISSLNYILGLYSDGFPRGFCMYLWFWLTLPQPLLFFYSSDHFPS